MSKIIWDNIGERTYETGVNQGVLYPFDSSKEAGKQYAPGVAWNGLTTVTESPSGAEANDIYADNIKYLTLLSAESLGITVEAYTYPKEFEACDGSVEISTGVNIGQQARKVFGLCYRSIIGNDTEGEAHGYKLHLVYGCQASPSERSYQTVNDSPEANSFSWEVSTTPINVEGHKPTSIVTLDSTKVSKKGMEAVEAALYGTETTEAYLPLPDDIVQIITDAEAAG